MNARERFNAVLAFEKPDRLPFMEFMRYWPETRDRWNAEGMPANADAGEYFGYDRFEWLDVNFNMVPPFAEEILQEDAATRTVRDETGVVKREFKYGSAMPHYIEFPIQARDDFHALIERLDPAAPQRYPAGWPEQVEQLRWRDYPVGLVCRGLLAFMRDFMPFEQMALTFVTDPDWVREMMDFQTDFMMRLWERALRDVDVDYIQLGEDMAYKGGPMISPQMVSEFMVPRYRRLTSFLKEHGVNNIIVDSDGDIRSLIPLFLEGGVTGVLPMENNAGCDPVPIREQFPRLQMIGGIDKQVIEKGGEHIARELVYKVGTLGPLGGYIPSFDHSVHPGVLLEVYRLYLAQLREYCQRAV